MVGPRSPLENPTFLGSTVPSSRTSFAAMRPLARTPEELETLFEDAFVIRDREALASLFEEGALLAEDRQRAEARGAAEIGRLAGALWKNGHMHVADPYRVLQARGTALVLARRSIDVLHRDGDGGWRYAISLLTGKDTHEEMR